MISETLDRMTRDENTDTPSAVEGSGGTSTIDYAQQIALLSNRLEAVENALNDIRSVEPHVPIETVNPSVEETNITETSEDNPGETSEQKEEEKIE